ncbi:hypothetical protein [Pontivivens ytuae]|nr:hypothetical protein [Pontivivens ytuae]
MNWFASQGMILEPISSGRSFKKNNGIIFCAVHLLELWQDMLLRLRQENHYMQAETGLIV